MQQTYTYETPLTWDDGLRFKGVPEDGLECTIKYTYYKGSDQTWTEPATEDEVEILEVYGPDQKPYHETVIDWAALHKSLESKLLDDAYAKYHSL